MVELFTLSNRGSMFRIMAVAVTLVGVDCTFHRQLLKFTANGSFSCRLTVTSLDTLPLFPQKRQLTNAACRLPVTMVFPSEMASDMASTGCVWRIKLLE